MPLRPRSQERSRIALQRSALPSTGEIPGFKVLAIPVVVGWRER